MGPVAQTMEIEPDSREGHGPAPDPLIGRTLLHYRVIERIGQGGMSVVYRGHDEHLQRDVAVKVLHPFLAEKPECRTRLVREARAVARLEHPNVLKVFDFSGDPPTLDEKPGGRRAWGTHEGFIIAELVKGPTLKRYAEKHILWRVPEVGAMVVWQLAYALAHAHENGIIHRDLKPENVMVREDGVLKLMDFGIAQIVDQEGLTVTGALLGSPAHMAPECIDGEPANEQSDLFSLGTVLYWITTGVLPFEALTPHALLKQIVEGRSTPAQQRSRRISDDLARVLQKALATRPADRYPSATALAQALAEVLQRAGLPPSRAMLERILAAPDVEIEGARTAVRAAFLERAGRLLEEQQPARALSCLNRVLADDAADVDALELLAKTHPEDEAIAPTPSTPASISVTESPTRLHRSSLVRWAALFAAAVGLVSSAVLVARGVDNAAEAGRVQAAAPDPGRDIFTDGTTQGEPGGLASLGPGAVDAVDVDPTTPPLAARPAERKGKGGTASAFVEARKIAPAPVLTPLPAAAATRRSVTFRVNTWADVYVDGQLLGRAQPNLEASLGVGRHIAVFRNPKAADDERTFEVVASGPAPIVQAKLEAKPAALVVHCTVSGAFVSVGGGRSGKTAQETMDRPLLVPLSGEGGRQTLEVFVYKEGYLPYRKDHVFLAGSTLSLDVVLEPQADEVPPP